MNGPIDFPRYVHPSGGVGGNQAEIGSGAVDLRAVIADNLGSSCSHEPVCDAVHQVLEPGTLTSDHYCCRSTGSLCEAVYDGYYDGIVSGDRVDTIYRAVTRWSSRPQTTRP